MCIRDSFYAYPFYGVPYPYYYPYGYGYGYPYAYPYYYPYPGADYGDATPPPYASSPEASAPPSGEAPPPGEALPPGEGPPSGEAPPPQAEAEGIPPVDLSTYGLIQIQGVPEGAKIDLDDRFWLEGSRELDHRWLALPSGTHTIDIRATGYESSERRVDITAGDRKVLKVRLSRAANG